jgi:hypothetical protein
LPSKRWFLSFVGIVAFVAGAVAFVNYRIDFYGLFRESKGRKLRVYSNERTTKYLFGYNYVPSNFDGLLVGSSISDNWDTGKITSSRVFNASISGGNISEVKLIAENALKRGKFRLVLFCIHPYMTESHGRKSGYMTPSEYWGALGSVQLIKEYLEILFVAVGLHRQQFDEFGRNSFESSSRNPRPPKEQNLRLVLSVDPSAVLEYRQLVDLARERGTKIVAFIPPIEYERYQVNRASYEAYYSRMSAIFRKDEPIIDFNGPEFDALRKNPESFSDGSHLSTTAADLVAHELNTALEHALAPR